MIRELKNNIRDVFSRRVLRDTKTGMFISPSMIEMEDYIFGKSRAHTEEWYPKLFKNSPILMFVVIMILIQMLRGELNEG